MAGEAIFDFQELVRLGLPVETCGPGERIFSAEEDARAMYVVLSGEVEISVYGEVLDRVGAGGVFGEMALVDGNPRNATATATAATELIAIDRELFIRLVRGAPEFALAIMSQMAKRIRQMNESL